MDSPEYAEAESPERPATSGAALDRLLGERIRHRRRMVGLSLAQVAETTGTSIGLLSQIERGLSSPSVRLLSGLAEVLQLSLGDFFVEARPVAPRREDNIVTRAQARKKLAFWRAGISKELVTPQTETRGTDVFIVSVEAGGTTGAQVYTHAGEDAGFVLEGELELSVDGENYLLRPGDGFRFKSTLPHSFRNPGRTSTRVIWVNAPVDDLPATPAVGS
ncbi:MAG: transcriptional regulator MerR family [Rubritepida sp.]|nr:transcriptional regulator MerR family [Rubritepida sp.]